MKFRLFLVALLAGLFGVQTLSAADQKYTGNAPSTVASATANDSKTFYLYNLGQKKFLDQGGIWGTQIWLGNGLPLTLAATGNNYNIKTTSNGLAIVAGSTHIEAAQYQVFTDQLSNNSSNSSSTTVYGAFAFTQVTSGDWTNAYTISIKFGSESKTYYLVANADNSITTTTTAPTTADGYWVLVTKQNLLDEFKTASSAGAQAVECSFVISDPGFIREGAASNWKTGDSSNSGSLSNGTTVTRPKADDKYYVYGHKENTSGSIDNNHEFVSWVDLGESVTINCTDNVSTFSTKNTKKEDTKATYYLGNGYGGTTKIAYQDNTSADSTKYTKITQSQAVYGGDWTANIHGASGKVYQSQTVTIAAGRYMVKAEGFSTDGTGYLFAQGGSDENPDADHYQKIAFETVSDRPETYVQAAHLINGGGYEKNVTVTVEKETTLTFGVVVESGDTDSWTCFDNFSLQYLGEANINLILDEDQTEAKYINDQVNTEKNQRLYLKRSFKPNMWNSVVLPVNLSSGQIKGAFGGDQVRVSVLSSTSEDGKQIYFVPVDMNNNSKAIEAGKVYIIKPTTAMPTGLGEVKSTKVTDLTLSDSYYTIDMVTLDANVPEDGQVVPTDVVVSVEDNGIKHCGSYITVDKTPKDGATATEFAIPESTYVLSNGKWYYNEGTGIYKVKGFRGWIATNQNPDDAKQTVVSINGIVDDVTAIEGITVDRPVKKMADGVYTLSGQKVADGTSTAGLPAGIYIVGGQKYIVR